MAGQSLLAGHAELAVARTGGDDDRPARDARSSAVFTIFGLAARSTSITSSATSSAPNRSACLRIESIRSGPRMPSGKPGKFSTSVVFISAPPAVTEPSKTSGLSLALRRVQRRGVAGGTRADDDDIANVSHVPLLL